MWLRNPSHFACGFMFTLAACSSVGFAQISPPSDPVAQTRPTIVTGPAPIIIDQPGSYILGGNVVATGTVHGIKISASDVTLNLDGAVLDGAHTGLVGITVIGVQSNLHIYNGTITRWSRSGIAATDASASQYDRLRINNNGTGNAHSGLITGRECLITDCVSSSNAGSGISTGRTCVVQSCIVSGNGTSGMVVGQESIVRDCTARGNTGDGINIGARSVITHCSAAANGDGIIAGVSTIVERCTVVNNTNVGVSGSANGAITECVITGGMKGILASSRIRIVANKISSVNGPCIYLDAKYNYVDRNVVDNCVNGIQTDRGNASPSTDNLIMNNVASNSSGNGSPSASYDIGPINALAHVSYVPGVDGFSSTGNYNNFSR